MRSEISKDVIKYRKEHFAKGTRVKLVKMDDPQAPPVGTLGTVKNVDDIGTIHISWDNGSGLGATIGEDLVEII